MRPLILVLVSAACTPFDPSFSGAPFFCGSAAPQCPDGLICVASGGGSGVCEDSAGSGGSGGSGACSQPVTGTLATWQFVAEPGTQLQTPAVSPAAAGITASGITRSSALQPQPGNDSMNSSGWPTGASADPNAYYTLMVSGPADCTLEVASLATDMSSSATGPATAVVATSADQFAATSAVSTTAPSTPSVTASASGGAAIEIRISGFSASATTGTLRLQNTLTLTGSLH